MYTADAAPLLRVFANVAAERGWDLEGQISGYAEESRYFALVKAGQVAGGVKLVLGSERGLPITSVWPEIGLVGRTDVAELAFLAFSNEQRGNVDELWTVTVEMWRFCVAHGIREVWAELVPRNLRLYARLGWPFVAVGPQRDYLGEPSLPCRMTVDDARAVVTTRARGAGRFHDVAQQGLRDDARVSVHCAQGSSPLPETEIAAPY